VSAIDRALSIVLLGIPVALLGASITQGAPQPLLLLVPWLVVAWHVPRHGSVEARILPPAAVQARRLVVTILLVLVAGTAAVLAGLAGLTVATIDRGAWIGAGLAAAVAAIAWLASRAPLFRDTALVSLVPKPLALALAVTALALAIADRVVLFQYTLFLAVLAGVATVLASATIQGLRRLRAGAKPVDLELPLAALFLGALLSSFVATLELSALGSYDLVQLSDRSKRHDLTPSRRARINAFGFRGPERPMAKPPGVLRVAVLGDSTTYGWFVAEEDTFARQLEGRLAGAVPGRTVEVLNAGVPAYSLWMIREQYAVKVAAHHPDVVVLVDGGNAEATPSDDYRRKLSELLDELRASGAVPILCGYPFGPGPGAATWQTGVKAQLAAEQHIAFVDLATAARPLGDRFFQRDGYHPTAAGHAAIAALLEPVVRDALQAVSVGS